MCHYPAITPGPLTCEVARPSPPQDFSLDDDGPDLLQDREPRGVDAFCGQSTDPFCHHGSRRSMAVMTPEAVSTRFLRPRMLATVPPPMAPTRVHRSCPESEYDRNRYVLHCIFAPLILRPLDRLARRLEHLGYEVHLELR